MEAWPAAGFRPFSYGQGLGRLALKWQPLKTRLFVCAKSLLGHEAVTVRLHFVASSGG